MCELQLLPDLWFDEEIIDELLWNVVSESFFGVINVVFFKYQDILHDVFVEVQQLGVGPVLTFVDGDPSLDCNMVCVIFVRFALEAWKQHGLHDITKESTTTGTLSTHIHTHSHSHINDLPLKWLTLAALIRFCWHCKHMVSFRLGSGDMLECNFCTACWICHRFR